jgi:hypothetical protein
MIIVDIIDVKLEAESNFYIIAYGAKYTYTENL